MIDRELDHSGTRIAPAENESKEREKKGRGRKKNTVPKTHQNYNMVHNSKVSSSSEEVLLLCCHCNRRQNEGLSGHFFFFRQSGVVQGCPWTQKQSILAMIWGCKLHPPQRVQLLCSMVQQRLLHCIWEGAHAGDLFWPQVITPSTMLKLTVVLVVRWATYFKCIDSGGLYGPFNLEAILVVNKRNRT